MIRTGNLFANIPTHLADERFDTLLTRPGVRIERIVSTAHASAPDFWYDQPQDEWVCVLAGSASLIVEGETQPRVMQPGDWLELPAHVRHRVEWTDAAQPTVWLAIHIDAALR